MVKRVRKSSGFKKFVITCSALITAQVTFLAVYSGKGPAELTPRDVVAAALKSSGDMPDARRETMRVQLALADFRTRSGAFPKALSELMPEYFDVLPNDPETGQALVYTVSNGRYRLGQPGKAGAKPADGAEKTGGAAGSVIDELNIDPVLLASLEQDDSTRASYVYDPTGKRDPFMPFDLTPKVTGLGGTELEQYAIGQLRYTSYLASTGEPIAIVENSLRRGFTVRKGTKIGLNGGVVIDILPTKIQVLESVLDPITGEKKNATIELELGTNKK